VIAIAVMNRILRARVHAATQAVDRAERGLRLIGRLIARFEAESFRSPRLAALHRAIVETRASLEVAALSRWVTRLAWQGNQFFAPLGILLLWGPQIACAIERCGSPELAATSRSGSMRSPTWRRSSRSAYA
jgi:hypothetical protein